MGSLAIAPTIRPTRMCRSPVALAPVGRERRPHITAITLARAEPEWAVTLGITTSIALATSGVVMDLEADGEDLGGSFRTRASRPHMVGLATGR